MSRIAIIDSANLSLEVSSDGGTNYHRMANIGNVSVSGGEAPQTEVRTVDGVAQRTGESGVPSMTVEMPSLLPHMAFATTIRDAQDNNSTLTVRLTLSESVVIDGGTTSGNTAAIADTGIVTFAGSNRPDLNAATTLVAPGHILKLSGSNYVIDSINSTPAIVVSPAPASPVAAATGWDIVAPSLRSGPFRAKVRTGLLNNYTISADGVLSGSIEFSLENTLPAWVIA